MRKVLVTIAAVVVLGGVTFGWLFLQNQSAPASNDKPTSSASKSEKTVNPKEHNYTDIDFARKMIVHNQQGIQIADIAKRNATSEQVRQIAVRISKELTNDTRKYVDWLTEWKSTYFNLSDFPEMDGHDMYPTYPGMASFGELNTLEAATGASVDEQFLRLMIARHEGANEMAGDSLAFRNMQFGQMIDLKTKTLKRQAEEIRTMKQLQVKGE